MTPFIGQIMLWAGNYAPKDWAFCDGRILQITEYQALFAIIGNQYGGDGRSTFALPDLRGRLAVGFQNSIGERGQKYGVEQVQLAADQLPAHTHPNSNLLATSSGGTGTDPTGAALSSGGRENEYVQNADLDITMQADTVVVGNPPGNSAPVYNMQPSLALNYVISLDGIFPPRN